MIQFSYSFLEAFDQCPEKARGTFVTRKYKRKWAAATEGGIDAHAALEARLKGKTPLPPFLEGAEPIARSLERAGTVETEVLLGVTEWIKPHNSWGAWLRGKFDVVVRRAPKAIIADWKTGKVREKEDQVELGALLLMETDPTIEEVTGFNIWLKTGAIGIPYRFHRDGKTARWGRWIAKIRKVEGLDPGIEWEKRPSGLCPWCPISSCEHYRGG